MKKIIDRNYLEGIVIGTIIYLIYIQFNNKPKNKTNEIKPVNLLNYIKTNNNDNLSLPKFINTNYFIFIIIFTYIYNKIKKNLKDRYI
tara:strand:- start:2725 stop:2988 length:264 start_codon:yes stop_codon:yes gene_type:complete